MFTDDKVLVNPDAHHLTSEHQLAGHLDVFFRRLWVPRRVIVDKNHGGRMLLQSGANHLPRVNRTGRQGTFEEHFRVDHLVLGIQVDRGKVLPLLVPQTVVQVVE